MKLAWKYGLITGGGSALWVLAEYALGFHTTRLAYGQVSGYLSSIVPITVFLVALNDLKRKRNGELRFWEGIKLGAAISAIAAFIIAVFFWLYYGYINQGFHDLLLQGMKEQIAATATGADQMTAQITLMEFLYSSPMQEIIIFAGTFFEGLFLSGLIAVFLRTRKSEART